MFGSPTLVLLVTLGATTAIRLMVAGLSGLTDDEAYYRLWSLAPTMSYLDHPPMVAWMIAAGRFVAGDNPIGVRLCAVLTLSVGLLVLWRSAHMLFGAIVARRAVWFALAMPLLAVGGVIITPDTPSVLFWGLTFWALTELHVSRNANWWLAVGVCAGLGLLSKFTNLFVGVGIAVWLILYPENRRWFRAWQLWVGGGLAVVLALPVVVWNWNHGWASFAKQFGRVVRGEPFTFRYLGELVGGYIGLASPLIALLALVGCLRVASSALAVRDQLRALLVVALLPLFAYLVAHAIHDSVPPNWAAPLYPFLAVCAAVAVGEPWRWLPDSERAKARVATWATGTGLLMSGLLLLHAAYPLIVVSGTRDPTSQMRGWPEFARAVDEARRASGACWIATWSYATTGQLAYALSPATPVVQLNERIRYAHLPAVDETLFGCPGVLVELERRVSPDKLRARFADVQTLGRITRGYAGVPIASYALYRLASPRGSVLSNDMP
jgi:hypothetical protein